MRVTEYRVRRGSGGSGASRGGDGLVRELECLVDSSVSLLTDCRVTRPWGLEGGGDGAAGANYLVHAGRGKKLPEKPTFSLQRATGFASRLQAAADGAVLDAVS